MPKISLAMTKKQRKDMEPKAPSPGDIQGPKYPYGTEITLRDDQAIKLGLDRMSADTEVTITARGKVTRIEKRERAGESNPSVEVGIQLTEAEIYPAKVKTEGEMFEDVAGRDFET